MPEGHTIHRLARDHGEWFAGQRVRASSPQGRFPAAAELDRRRLVATDAYGKHLLHRFDDGRSVHIHLGLFGKVFHHALPPRGRPPLPRDTVRYRLVAPGHAIDLIGPTACEMLDEAQVEALVARLGPDPIRDDADPERAWTKLQRRSSPLGQALMDQSVLAGVGNVYRAEVLFVHGLHPELPARDLDRATWDELWATLVSWLRRGVRERRIITVDPAEAGVPRSRMRRADATYVYRQERCRRCGTAVRRYGLGGRWAYVCERCQPPPGRGRGAARRSRRRTTNAGGSR